MDNPEAARGPHQTEHMSVATASVPPGGRTFPLLRPQTPVLRRGPDQVQIGVDSADAVILTGLSANVDWVFPMLDGCHHVHALTRACSSRQVDPQLVVRLLGLLGDAGLLLEGGRAGRPPASPPATSRVRLVGAGSLGTAVAELLVDSGIGTLYVADSEPVDRIVHPTAGALATNAEALGSELGARSQRLRSAARISVVNHWSKPDGLRLDLTVVAADTWECDRVIADALVRADQPHLLVRPRGAEVVVGPLVIPGQTACLRCTDLTRAAADPVWPTVLRQLCRLRCTTDPALIGWAAGTAATQALGYLNAGLPETYGHTVELGAPEYCTRWRAWAAHPECGCCWGRTAEWGHEQRPGGQARLRRDSKPPTAAARR